MHVWRRKIDMQNGERFRKRFDEQLFELVESVVLELSEHLEIWFWWT